MAEEEKGFVIKDRRSFDERGDLKGEGGQEQAAKEPKEEEKKQGPRAGQDQRTMLPEVNFSYFLISLSSSALLHLGEIADPQTGEKRKDLPIAKHTIDTIAMLKEKTKGNLSDDEQKALDSILADLRWRYVKAVQ